MSEQNLAVILRVAEEIQKGNALISDAPHYRAAYNIIARRDSRKLDDAFNSLIGGDHEVRIVSSPVSVADPRGIHSSPPEAPPPRDDSIITADFVAWSTSYSGPPFSFLHCDFPYGIGLDQSAQGNTASWGSYRDDEATYWKLCGVLAHSLDLLLTPSTHVLF